MDSQDSFFEAVMLLKNAKDYTEVFATADRKEMKSTYRRLLKAVHPDLADVAYRDVASTMTDKLLQYYNDACQSLTAGTFGQHIWQTTFTSSIATHAVMAENSQFSDMTVGLRAQTTLDVRIVETFVKLARVPRDNELLNTEAAALCDLRRDSGPEHTMFYPELIDSFAVADGRKRVQANAMTWQIGFLNLEEVRMLYPDGIHPLDMGWIWRRVLWALGGAHGCGWIHGAVLPRHIMIHPDLHGVLLVDWCYATSKTSSTTSYRPITAIVGGMRDWYPPEVLAKKAPLPKVDLVMAARTMQYVMGIDPYKGIWPACVPLPMRQYFARILSSKDDLSAYELLSEFDGLLERLGNPYYPRTYRPLKI